VCQACQKREIRFGRIREIEKKKKRDVLEVDGDLKSNLSHVFNFWGSVICVFNLIYRETTTELDNRLLVFYYCLPNSITTFTLIILLQILPFLMYQYTHWVTNLIPQNLVFLFSC